MLLLFLNLSPLLLHLFARAATVQPPVTRKKISTVDIASEYDDYDYSTPPEVMFPAKTTLLRRSQEFCEYNPCLENQEPCAQTSSRTGCLCPGMSEANLPPRSPRLKDFSTVTEGEHIGSVEVHWCEPLSVVVKYRVVVEKSDKPALEFSHVSRRGLVGSLEPGDKVCVQAVNNAGSSSPSDYSCSRYEHDAHKSDHTLLVGVIGGGVALVALLIIVAVLLVKCKACKKMKDSAADGLGNPSFSTGGTL